MINGKDLVVETPETGRRRHPQGAHGGAAPSGSSVFTDCTLTGIKHIVAKRKLQSMVRGTQLVRDALTGS